MSHAGPARRWSGLAVLAGLAGVFWSQVRWARVSNFGGYDEWLILWLTSRGIVSFPYARRPLELVWALPAPLLFPHRWLGFRLLHAAYLFLGALLFYRLCRRLIPRHLPIAFLAAAFSLTWAPSDPVRLQLVESIGYAGVTFGSLLALLLLVESWPARSPLGLAAGMGVGFATTLGYESVLPLLAAGALLLWMAAAEKPRRLWVWMALWEGMVGLAAARILWQFLGTGSYQGAMGLDWRPLAVGARLLHQYALHLRPLAMLPEGTLAPALVSAITAAAAVALATVRRGEILAGPDARPRCVALMALGLALAGCGYAFFVLSAGVREAERTEFLSAPGIGLFLAASAGLVATAMPVRLRGPALAAAAAWIVGVGTAHVVARQREWDATSAYPGQKRALAGLVAAVPDVRPHTLVVLLDEPKSWPATFGFRAAVEYLYQRRATGIVMGAWPYLFPTYFTPDGIRTEPHPEIQAPWDCPPTRHRYDEVVVARIAAAGTLQVLDRWPAEELSALPRGAAYAPRARIVSGSLPRDEPEILAAP